MGDRIGRRHGKGGKGRKTCRWNGQEENNNHTLTAVSFVELSE